MPAEGAFAIRFIDLDTPDEQGVQHTFLEPVSYARSRARATTRPARSSASTT